MRQVRHVRQAETSGELLAVDCYEYHHVSIQKYKISATVHWSSCGLRWQLVSLADNLNNWVQSWFANTERTPTETRKRE